MKCLIFVFLIVLISLVSAQSDTAKELSCTGNHVHCLNRKECVHNLRLCDGVVDCVDESDETQCGAEYCSGFRCDSGECLDLKMVCDGDFNCHDDSDERNCTNSPAIMTFACPNGYSLCPNTTEKCIPQSAFCDGFNDCPDQHDEIHCNDIESCHEENGFFLCKDNSKCLKIHFFCDGSPQCTDGSDENGKCGIYCKEIQCQGECYRTPAGPRCACQKGYKFENDECVDINECNSEHQVCDHFCENTKGSFKCSCASDYQLLDDDVTCRIEGKALLLYAVGNKIESSFTDSSKSSIIWEGDMSVQVSGLAYDPIDKKVYFILNEEKIYSTNVLDHDDGELFIKQGLKKPQRLAIDWISRNLYVTDNKSGQIIVCNLHNKECTPVIKEIKGVRALQIDLKNKNLYFTSMSLNSIEKSNLDGSNRKVIVKEGVVWPNGLAIDAPAKRLFWVDGRKHQIDSSDLDGKNIKNVLNEDATHAYSIAVWQDKVYWTSLNKNGNHKEIHSCRKRDGKEWQMFFKSNKQVNFLLIHHDSMTIRNNDVCNNNYERICSHICVPKGLSEKVCMCPEGMILSINGRNCHEKSGVIPIVGLESRVYNVHTRQIGRGKVQSKFQDYKFGFISDMAFDQQNLLYIADTKEGAILEANLQRQKVRSLLSNIVHPISIALDWLRGNLYWINGFHHTIEVTRTTMDVRKVLIDNLRNPTDIAVDIKDGFLYVLDNGMFSIIYKCELNGTNCKNLVQTGTKEISSIFIDNTIIPSKLYWTDFKKNTLERVSVSGSDQEIVIRHLTHPKKLYVTKNEIFWTEQKSSVFHVATKNGSLPVKHLDLDLPFVPDNEWYMALSIIGLEKENLDNPCTQDGSPYCHHLCFSKDNEMICDCANGLTLKDTQCEINACKDHQYKCDNGECILKKYFCDGSSDCDDNSDEISCTSRNCTGKFQCDDGLCIHLEEHCNGYPDCEDSSDEKIEICSKKKCSFQDDFRCMSGECIPYIWRCNGEIQCHDGSDENSTMCDQVQCPDKHQKCNNGHCIPENWWCDGFPDCRAGEDEEKCPCDTDEFTCEDGSCVSISNYCSGHEMCETGNVNITCDSDDPIFKCELDYIPCDAAASKCIPMTSWCDGKIDCPNNEDESEKCMKCNDNEVECDNEKRCIDRKWICDGEKDCDNGWDEIVCEPKQEEECSDFKCTDGTCISNSQVCNGHNDCDDGIDEYCMCKKNNGNCDQICHESGEKVLCSCRKGFRLSTFDKISCYDENECRERAGICHHICINRYGTYACECHEGYELAEDELTCKRTDNKHWEIALIENSKLMVKNDLTAQSLVEIQTPMDIKRLTYDPQNNNFLGLTGNGELYQSKSNSWQPIIKASNVMSFTLDYTNRNLYFAYKKKNSKKSLNDLGTAIKVINLETKLTRTVVTVPGMVTAMKYFAYNYHLITCETSPTMGTKLVSQNLDGSESNILAKTKIDICDSIAVDEVGHRIYWLDSHDRIESVDFIGYGRQKFSSKLIRGAHNLNLFYHNLMWYNTEHHSIVKCSLHDPNTCSEMYFHDVTFTTLQPVYSHANSTPCLKKDCQQNTVCLPQNAFNAKCFCSDGFVLENSTCIKTGNFIGKCSDIPCNEGVCIQKTENTAVCKCLPNYVGINCNIIQESAQTDDDNPGIAIGIIVFILLLVGAVILCYFFYNKQINLKEKRFFNRLPFSNRSFNLMRNESSPSESERPCLYNKPNQEVTMQKQNSAGSNDSAIVVECDAPNLDNEVSPQSAVRTFHRQNTMYENLI